MNYLEQFAAEHGISAAPEGTPLMQHLLTTLQGEKREKFAELLKSVPTKSTPEQDTIRDDIHRRLKAMPADATAEDWEREFPSVSAEEAVSRLQSGL
jgi:hypothetical protein